MTKTVDIKYITVFIKMSLMHNPVPKLNHTYMCVCDFCNFFKTARVLKK